MWIYTSVIVALAALVIERITGYPGFIHARIGHPVEWIGRLISRLDSHLNRPGGRRTKGVAMIAIVLAVVGAVSFGIAILLRALPWGWVAEAVLATSLLAQSDLKAYVARVAGALDAGIENGRDALRHIVGRDASALDEEGIARGAIESLAENTSDGIVAPAFYLAVFGLPGIALYKAINTADSMVGYKSDRYLEFGWASARLDDVVNWLPARLTGLLFTGAAALTSPNAAAGALEAMWRDARKHASPNAGWPESAIAGALDIRLGGPRSYGGRIVELPWMGDGRTDIDRTDIRRALRLYSQTLTLMVALLGFAVLFVVNSR